MRENSNEYFKKNENILRMFLIVLKIKIICINGLNEIIKVVKLKVGIIF